MKPILIYTLITLFCLNTYSKDNAEKDSIPEKMQWFHDAKLGIFIHWGIYAVDGTRESWAFFRGNTTYDEYMSQKKGFTASNYNPEQWAKLFKEAGAKYAVLTSKHHDGVALFDTKYSELNVVDETPAGKDLIKPYCNALRKNGLKVGLYFSHLDWSHPDYPTIVPHNKLFKEKRNKFAYPPKGEENILRWEKFLTFHRGQIKEICTNFRPDLLWFDGGWERDKEQWKMKELKDSILTWNPGVIINSRMKGHGDYETPEQAIPITLPNDKWELCLTMNNSWGYRHSDTNYKSTREIIRTFSEIIGKGGNLLLDIGPKEDGTIPDPQVKRLKALGQWIKKHEVAVYPTTKGLPYGHYFGPSTLSKDKKSIYLFVFHKPIDYLSVKGIRNDITSVKILGTNEELKYSRSGGAPWVNIPGVLRISAPEKMDPYVTVIEINLKDKLDLYHGPGFKKHEN